MITAIETHVVEPGITVVAISGRLNLGNSLVSAESAIQKLIEGGCRRLVVNLAELKSIDSAGIGMLIACNGQMELAGGRMRIGGSVGAVLQSFTIVHMDRVVPLDADAAISCAQLEKDI